MAINIRRVVGDLGAKARITLTAVTDANGTLVTAGTLTLRAAGLFEGAMTHQTGGTWIYDPIAGDISRSGKFLLEAHLENGGQVTIPVDGSWYLLVRDRATEPPAA